MSCEEEETMLKNAFEKGVVRIPTTEILLWSKADKIAKEFAGGLCTKEEIINAGIKIPDDLSQWVYIKRNDGGADVVQLGTLRHERYTSWLDRHGNVDWLERIEERRESTQADHIYAKRCEKKNPTYIPKDFTKENQLWEEIVFSKRADKQDEMRNNFHSVEKQNEMMKKAFGKNIIRIRTDEQYINYEQAKNVAHEKALRLPTLEEMQESGIIESDNMSLFAFVQRPDNKADAVQLGLAHETVKERYWSLIDKLGEAEWLNNHEPK